MILKKVQRTKENTMNIKCQKKKKNAVALIYVTRISASLTIRKKTKKKKIEILFIISHIDKNLKVGLYVHLASCKSQRLYIFFVRIQNGITVWGEFGSIFQNYTFIYPLNQKFYF